MKKYTIYDGPEGPLLLAVDDDGRVIRLHFVDGAPPIEPDWEEDADALGVVTRQLDEYFAGERTDFDLDLAPEGTPFQLAVWNQLRRIPYGETISYGELAKRVDRPGAARAVGAANGQNPIAIIIPCHRVIGADGSLTGFGGGLPWKRWLLGREQPQGSLLGT
ncbi:MAG: methylated-DNA--[protein]-cysteine S-methyltransferase [Acidimicrobiia bacterium]|nr:methylated-DNA--[protein]-cysteine S-methyltransferase [Acidimicrobiia bacterium]